MRERLARLALHAFPAEWRKTRGNELLSTLLESSLVSPRRFPIEVGSVVRAGLRGRALVNAGSGVKRTIGDGLCLGGSWLLTLFLSANVGSRIHGRHPGDPEFLPLLALVLLTVALVCLASGHERLAGIAGAAFVADLAFAPSGDPLSTRNRVALTIPLVCFAALLATPRKHGHRRSPGWLVAAPVLAMAGSLGDDSIATIVGLGALLLVPLAISCARNDPRLLIACGCVAAYIGVLMIQDPGGPDLPSLLVASVLPLVLLATVVRGTYQHRGTS